MSEHFAVSQTYWHCRPFVLKQWKRTENISVSPGFCTETCEVYFMDERAVSRLCPAYALTYIAVRDGIVITTRTNWSQFLLCAASRKKCYWITHWTVLASRRGDHRDGLVAVKWETTVPLFAVFLMFQPPAPRYVNEYRTAVLLAGNCTRHIAAAGDVCACTPPNVLGWSHQGGSDGRYM
jgi:hypothetical protein